jgi:hypothetical protein
MKYLLLLFVFFAFPQQDIKKELEKAFINHYNDYDQKKNTVTKIYVADLIKIEEKDDIFIDSLKISINETFLQLHRQLHDLYLEHAFKFNEHAINAKKRGDMKLFEKNLKTAQENEDDAKKTRETIKEYEIKNLLLTDGLNNKVPSYKIWYAYFNVNMVYDHTKNPRQHKGVIKMAFTKDYKFIPID